MKKLKVGLIGFGLSGKIFHAGLLKDHSGFQIEMVSSSRKDEVEACLPHVKVVSDPTELIENQELDLIINCAPNSFHYPLTAQALLAGKHVVVEKPFVNDVDEGTRLISLAKRSNRLLSVFHNRRWDADFLTVQKLLRQNKLGEIKQFESHFDRWRPTSRPDRWREQPGSGSGIFYDLGAHLIDQVLILFGEPEQLIADIAQQKAQTDIDDYFHIIMKYGSLRVILHGSSFTEATPRFQIFGNKTNFIKYGLDRQESQLKSGVSMRDATFGEELPAQYGQIIDPQHGTSQTLKSERGAYTAFYDGIYDSIINGHQCPPVSAEDALRVIKLINLSQQSSNEGKAVVVKPL